MLWRKHKSASISASESGRRIRIACTRCCHGGDSDGAIRSRWLLAPNGIKYALYYLLTLSISVAHALPIPAASTSSKLNLMVGLSNVELQPDSYIITTPSSITEAATVAINPLPGLSGHLARADAHAGISAASILKTGGTITSVQPVFDIEMRHQTLAESWWPGPLAARAKAVSEAGFSDFVITAKPGAELTLGWNLELLNLDTTPLASLSLMQHAVSIAVTPLNGESTITKTITLGLSALSQDGETRWQATDTPGSADIGDWLTDALGKGDALAAATAGGPTVTILLDTVQARGSSGEQKLTIDVDVTHKEYAIEAPLAPVKRVAEQAGSGDSDAMVHWDAGKRQLTFDVLPLNVLLDAWENPITGLGEADPLSGGYLEIDPLTYIGNFDGSGYFDSKGSIRLRTRDGQVAMEAALQGLIYDERLYESEGFNVFGPLLQTTPFIDFNSQWLLAFYERLNSESLYLPELFIGIEPENGLTREVGALNWSEDFSANVHATLSFAGIQPVGLPGSAALLLTGLLILKLRDKNPIAGRLYRLSIKGREILRFR